MASGDSGFEVLAIDAAASVPLGEGLEWVPVRRLLGVGAFGVNVFRAAKAGDVVIEDHVESTGQEELYVVLEGAARLTIGEEEIEIGAGTAVHLPDPEVRRRGIAAADDTAVLAVGAWRGRSYHPLPWEPIYLARPAMRDGDWAAAAETLRREAGEQLEAGIVRYRLAWCHARLGEDEIAVAELERAIAIDPGLRERARGDEAFDAIRGRDDWPGG